MTSTRAADLLEALRDHHERIEQMLATVTVTSGDDRRAVFRRVRRFLAAHEAAEQIFIHPRTDHSLEPSDIAERRIHEEEEASEILAQLEQTDVDSDAFDALFEQLSRSVAKHARAEELQELPEVIGTASPEVLDRMRQALEHVDVLVSHRGGPLGEGDRTFDWLLDAARADFRALRDEISGQGPPTRGSLL